MDNVETYLQDLEILFKLDLFNKFKRVNNSIVVTLLDGSQISIQINQLV